MLILRGIDFAVTSETSSNFLMSDHNLLFHIYDEKIFYK